MPQRKDKRAIHRLQASSRTVSERQFFNKPLSERRVFATGSTAPLPDPRADAADEVFSWLVKKIDMEQARDGGVDHFHHLAETLRSTNAMISRRQEEVAKLDQEVERAAAQQKEIEKEIAQEKKQRAKLETAVHEVSFKALSTGDHATAMEEAFARHRRDRAHLRARNGDIAANKALKEAKQYHKSKRILLERAVHEQMMHTAAKDQGRQLQLKIEKRVAALNKKANFLRAAVEKLKVEKRMAKQVQQDVADARQR